MKHRGFLSFGLIILLLPGISRAGDLELRNETDRINYSVGYQVGGDLAAQGLELNPEALLRGVQDAVKKNKPLISQEQMNATLVVLKKKIVADQQAKEKQAADENRKASAAFLEKNAKEKGVTVLPSGVQYKVIREGTGRKPTLKDQVKIHYRMSGVDGKEIGSTYVGGKPRVHPVSQAIPGLQEALLLMPEGSKWEIVLPLASASGRRDPLDDRGVMIYELELLSVLAGT